MTEKQLCSDCKHLEHDGMAGIWCGVHGNNKNYDCPKFEYNWGRLTKEEAINHLNRLYYENKQLKQAISDWKGSYDELYQDIEILEKENEQLKQFIKDLTTKGTGRIDLANGYSYNVNVLLTNIKGDD